MFSMGLHIGQYSDAENRLDNLLDNLNKRITACQVIYRITKVVKKPVGCNSRISSLVYCRGAAPTTSGRKVLVKPGGPCITYINTGLPDSEPPNQLLLLDLNSLTAPFKKPCAKPGSCHSSFRGPHHASSSTIQNLFLLNGQASETENLCCNPHWSNACPASHFSDFKFQVSHDCI